ncbi:zinc-dependent alcohol dehydrogenase [Microbacterium saperdae]|uniref:Zinc-binding dehydrogenase n=1 Tax=Microbacterium saperdae TaxID=69368 RepID=A0A543BIK0_9MICO|nr:zinc-binding alcohol dehydrogenase [Microbacterium saperdae]TQL84679.1 zinc-binding dehydrogenase [Microbacterium saperdae]GGM65033.1 dehydrogenase [Microbacterium saperdae]
MPQDTHAPDLSTSRIEATGRGRIALTSHAMPTQPLRPDEVEGVTIVSLVSPGTETNAIASDDETPRATGYAAVFRITAKGSEVSDLEVGQLVFCFGNHAGFQRAVARDVVAVPEGLDPAVAVFCRLMAVSWTTLVTTRARPASRVLIMGLGLVGNLAAQIFRAAGYRVTAVDPVESRRDIATSAGLPDVRANVPDLGEYSRFTEESFGVFDLAVDCSGHEAAVLDAAKTLKRGGELVLVGVPWRRRTELSAHELLDVVFHHYITLRSGWEWELPLYPQAYSAGNLLGNHAGAMQWLAEGRVNVDGLAESADPTDAQRIYDGLAASARLTALFRWSEN